MNDTWLNVGVILALVGAATYYSCLGSTTFWGGDQ